MQTQQNNPGNTHTSMIYMETAVDEVLELGLSQMWLRRAPMEPARGRGERLHDRQETQRGSVCRLFPAAVVGCGPH